MIDVALALVRHRRGRVMIVRREDGDPPWAFPGGKVQPGETAEQAAVRECAEETALIVTALRRLGERPWPSRGVNLVYVACELAPRVPGMSIATAGAGITELSWATPDLALTFMPDMGPPARAWLGL